jgi:hypothetical protein
MGTAIGKIGHCQKRITGSLMGRASGYRKNLLTLFVAVLS